MSNGTYAGDIAAPDAWAALSDESDATLIDVRTRAEWSFVGLPDLRPIAKTPILAEWQVYPAMQVSSGFVAAVTAELEKRGVGKDAPLYFLCRSGARSQSAAIAMTEAGYTACYNVIGGFEGPVGPDGHRGATDGWKARALPWAQS